MSVCLYARACMCAWACACVMGSMSVHGSKGLEIDFESNLRDKKSTKLRGTCAAGQVKVLSHEFASPQSLQAACPNARWIHFAGIPVRPVWLAYKDVRCNCIVGGQLRTGREWEEAESDACSSEGCALRLLLLMCSLLTAFPLTRVPRHAHLGRQRLGTRRTHPAHHLHTAVPLVGGDPQSSDWVRSADGGGGESRDTPGADGARRSGHGARCDELEVMVATGVLPDGERDWGYLTASRLAKLLSSKLSGRSPAKHLPTPVRSPFPMPSPFSPATSSLARTPNLCLHAYLNLNLLRG